VLAGCGVARAASARKLVKEGNQAYQDGKYPDALKSYEQAGEQEPDSGRIHFNKGAALYRQGDFSKALEEFEQAAVAASAGADRELEARAQYNAGNSFFRQSEKQQSADPRGAVDLLQRSAQAYQRALRLDPALIDAAHNLEVARLQMKHLLEQAQRTPQNGQGQPGSQNQNQKNQDQNQNLSQQLQKLLEQQQQASRQGEKLSQQQQQQGASQDLQDKTKELSDRQQDIQQQTEQLADQIEQQQNQQQKQQSASRLAPQNQVKQNLDRAASHQQHAQRKLDQQQLPAAGEDQKKAEDALRQAMQAAEGKPGGTPPEQQQAQGQPQQSEAEQQPQQAAAPQEQRSNELQRDGQDGEAPNENARNILDEERANRKQRQIRQMGGIKPVEKDW
jgi:Ca-activated chloride channel family protein